MYMYQQMPIQDPVLKPTHSISVMGTILGVIGLVFLIFSVILAYKVTTINK